MEFTQDNLNRLPYRELQKIAKNWGLRANRKKVELVENILHLQSSKTGDLDSNNLAIFYCQEGHGAHQPQARRPRVSRRQHMGVTQQQQNLEPSGIQHRGWLDLYTHHHHMGDGPSVHSPTSQANNWMYEYKMYREEFVFNTTTSNTQEIRLPPFQDTWDKDQSIWKGLIGYRGHQADIVFHSPYEIEYETRTDPDHFLWPRVDWRETSQIAPAQNTSRQQDNDLRISRLPDLGHIDNFEDIVQNWSSPNDWPWWDTWAYGGQNMYW